VEASVLVWSGYSKDDNSEAKIYASRMSAAEGNNAILITAPITATSIKIPFTTGGEAQTGVFVFSYDAYIKGN
ncbi:MAG TPA: hypothetical protein DDY25_05935, partial [Peptococcaceae bacterium]|nr:hypothetical protein [Peptococcaceae bacterium]